MLVRGTCLLLGCVLPLAVCAHGLSGADGGFVSSNEGTAFGPFAYLGAKHMVTGYDHLFFLAGVIFFLKRLSDVALYATLFAIGHSLTLLIGVLADVRVNEHLIDAVIGFSVVYKAWDNLGGLAGWQPNLPMVVLSFGLIHGFGLATKLQALELSPNGLLTNLLAFNLGVELGQLLALAALVLVFIWCRTRLWFDRFAVYANWALLTAGLTLMGYQLTGYLAV